MSLKDELKNITGKKKRYMLYRVAEMEAEVARKLANVTAGAYNSWLRPEDEFHRLHRRISELIINYKQEAIQMLRRDNQLNAVILEERIINKMIEEVDTGDYNLIRTNLARDVYTRLMGDLDFQPQVANMSWEQRIQNIFADPAKAVDSKDAMNQVIVETKPLPQLSDGGQEEPEIVAKPEEEIPDEQSGAIELLKKAARDILAGKEIGLNGTEIHQADSSQPPEYGEDETISESESGEEQTPETSEEREIIEGESEEEIPDEQVEGEPEAKEN
jgi:hypothetical protein